MTDDAFKAWLKRTSPREIADELARRFDLVELEIIHQILSEWIDEQERKEK